jgi:hypothetical protein
MRVKKNMFRSKVCSVAIQKARSCAGNFLRRLKTGFSSFRFPKSKRFLAAYFNVPSSLCCEIVFQRGE